MRHILEATGDEDGLEKFMIVVNSHVWLAKEKLVKFMKDMDKME